MRKTVVYLTWGTEAQLLTNATLSTLPLALLVLAPSGRSQKEELLVF